MTEQETNNDYEVHTNKVWEGRVAFRKQYIDEAFKAGKNLRCISDDRPDEVMTVPNFLIERRGRIRKKMDTDRTGWTGFLVDFWWKSDQEVEAEKRRKEESKQQKLL